MELGLYTFGDLPARQPGGEAAGRRLSEVVEAAKLADQAGLSVFGVGEHHRSDYAISSPAVVLGAIAAVTRRIRLTTAVTILSSADPVRVFDDFATVDLLSAGRAELTVGRALQCSGKRRRRIAPRPETGGDAGMRWIGDRVWIWRLFA